MEQMILGEFYFKISINSNFTIAQLNVMPFTKKQQYHRHWWEFWHLTQKSISSTLKQYWPSFNEPQQHLSSCLVPCCYWHFALISNSAIKHSRMILGRHSGLLKKFDRYPTKHFYYYILLCTNLSPFLRLFCCCSTTFMDCKVLVCLKDEIGLPTSAAW